MAKPGNLGLSQGRLTKCPESPNCVSSHADLSDDVHYIDPLPYDGDLISVTQAIDQVIENWPRTKVLVREASYFHLACTTMIFRFTDDLEIYIDEQEKKIHFRSASRIGYSDLGTNRKRVTKFKNDLKKLL